MQLMPNAIHVWGGIECTVHRLRDKYGDQVERNGHQHRITDLDLIAGLGIKTLRYPVLWEKIAPQGLAKADWGWADERLHKLRELGITPIAGLLHHGSGPKNTSLIDPDFPQKFTEFALAVAERYPWLELFTPINEPLTTARFSCLYGLWYPHLHDDHAFAIALFNQCKATIMAMEAIKKINPNAKLVQTEDMGKCQATRKLQYQADFENARRWISLDLLTGKLKDNPLMLNYFQAKAKVDTQTLDYFFNHSCAPDIIGINHYITSERFLDENRKKYPGWSYSSNGRDKYCDLDIVRADIHKRQGHYVILKETAERYGLPIALTEVHLGSTRDAQLRWFMEAYDAVVRLKSEGVDMRAITVWSILGAYDWNSLLTRQHNFYEPGVFDVRTGTPRPTAIAELITHLCRGEIPDHPVLQSEGWWKNPEHVHFMFGKRRDSRSLPSIEKMFPENLLSSVAHPLLIVGANGTLGRAFAHVCTMRNIPYLLLARRDLDILDKNAFEDLLQKHRPWALINAAGFVRVDDAETAPEICFRENGYGAEILAQVCEQQGIAFLTFSSDLVFDGLKNGGGDQNIPYVESDVPSPLNVYGESKRYAETQVLKHNPSALVIRTSAFFGPWDEHNFLAKMFESLTFGQHFFAASDQIISPTYVPDLVNHSLDLLIDKACGIWHLANPAVLSWADFARKVAQAAELDVRLIKAVTTAELGLQARRPRFSALGSERGVFLPSLDDAIGRYLSDRCVSSLMLAS